MKLNKIERWKQQGVLDYLSLQRYLDNLSSPQVQYFLKNFGIYSSNLNPQKLMIRVRNPGGRIEKEKLLFLLSVAKEYNLTLLPTTRAGLELHNIPKDKVFKLHHTLLKQGINTFATLVDNFRNIVTDPLDGLRKGIEVFPLIQEIDKIALSFLGALPRKFNTAIVGVEATSQRFLTNDLLFLGATKEGKVGFNIFWGGKNSSFAESANLFIPYERAKEFFLAVAKAYITNTTRESRNKVRLYHHLQKIGLEKFKEQVASFYPDQLEEEGVSFVKEEQAKEVYKKKEVYRIPFEQVGEELVLKSKEVRIGIDQHLYLVKPQDTTALSPSALELQACVGSRFCDFSLFDTKEAAKQLPLKRLAKMGIRVGYSGCLKGCGRHFVADIGLVGIRTNSFGKTEKGVRFYLGDGKREVKLLYWAVPLRKLNQLIEVVLDDFQESKEVSFSSYIQRRFKEVDDLASFYLQRIVGEGRNPLPKEAFKL